MLQGTNVNFRENLKIVEKKQFALDEASFIQVYSF